MKLSAHRLEQLRELMRQEEDLQKYIYMLTVSFQGQAKELFTARRALILETLTEMGLDPMKQYNLDAETGELTEIRQELSVYQPQGKAN